MTQPQGIRKPTASSRAAMPSSARVVDGDMEEFFEDSGELDAGPRNAALARLLLGTLHAHCVVAIERIDSAARTGWRVVYRIEG